MPPSSTQHSRVFSVVETGPTSPSVREASWSILMARVQNGDAVAYRRLLEEIAPYVRSLAAKWCREPDEVEEIVQDCPSSGFLRQPARQNKGGSGASVW